jgi:hypothetical protein
MRLRPEKVHDLADQIVEMIKSHPRLQPQAGDDHLRVVIGSVITDDLREEEDIEAEVDELIAQNAKVMEQQGIDPFAMRQKFKREIAKRRGFVL